jgi:hypothetical protein
MSKIIHIKIALNNLTNQTLTYIFLFIPCSNETNEISFLKFFQRLKVSIGRFLDFSKYILDHKIRF